MLEIYCGNGKGKTTAAIGLAVRAAGAGQRVIFCQFLKDGSSSETKILKEIDNITYMCCEECRGFVSSMTGETINLIKSRYRSILGEVSGLIAQGKTDLVIFDEFSAACSMGIIGRESALNVVMNNKDKVEIVITGREPPKELLDCADYISEIQSLRHPYDSGKPARKGIEF